MQSHSLGTIESTAASGNEYVDCRLLSHNGIGD